MQMLSSSFGLDPRAPRVVAHNREVREVLGAFAAGQPLRVPLFCHEWPGQHGLFAGEIGLDYREYYTDPEVMLWAQLEAARRRRELPIYDLVLAEAPERWPIAVDLWPVVAPGWVGCRLLYRKGAVIAHVGLGLSRDECDALSMPDPRTGGLLREVQQLWRALRDHQSEGLVFLGRPVGPVSHGVGTNGLFSLALDVRGPELMVDMREAPEFVDRFLRKLAAWIGALEAAWNGEPGPFSATDHGIDMLSARDWERFLAPVIEETNRERGTRPPPALHHCGRGAHLFAMIRRRFGLTDINTLTYPLIDVARVRRELGERVTVTAMIEDAIIRQGPPERIREVVRELMNSGAKGTGGFAMMVGDMLPGTPIDHRLALYEAVREYGGY